MNGCGIMENAKTDKFLRPICYESVFWDTILTIMVTGSASMGNYAYLHK